MTMTARLLAVLVVATACGGSADETTTTSTSTASSLATTATTSATATTTTIVPSTAVGVWQLTGLPTDGEDIPIVAVKIDNSSSGRPQEGLGEADLVFEVLVEGGIPRLIALFQSSIPAVVGPVRSLREVDPKLVAPFNVFFANSGGDASIRALLTGVARDVGDPLLGSIAYSRATDRSAPYNLMLQTAGLVGQTPLDGDVASIGFDDQTMVGEQALTVEVSMSAAHTVNYRWSSADQAYLRFNGESVHETADGEQIRATNVVIVYARQFDTGRRDRAGSVVPDYTVTGSGDAVIFRDGQGFPGTWERGTVDTFFRFFDPAGGQLRLAPGRTWVQIVPIGRSVSWQ